MLDKNRPPNRPGYKWEWREGCQCKSCPWKGNCLGESWPHWYGVKIRQPILMVGASISASASSAFGKYF